MTTQAVPPDAKVHRSLFHDSAREHVTGRAVYVDDIPEPRGLLYAALVTSPVAHGQLRGIDTSLAKASAGVHAVITAADIPGRNDVAPLPPLLTLSEAMAQQSYVRAPMRLERGDVDAAMAGAPRRLSGRFEVGGQEHFYLEGQVAFAWIDEGGAVSLHSSTQHPSEVQHICARLLGVSQAEVTVLVRRMGGGFGGKESNASWVAGVAAVACRLTNRPVKLRLPRITDMVVTGKRHGFL